MPLQIRLVHDYAIIKSKNAGSTSSMILSLKPLYYKNCFLLPCYYDGLGQLVQAIDWNYKPNGPTRSLHLPGTYSEISRPGEESKDLARSTYGYVLDGEGELQLVRRVSYTKGIDDAPEFLFARTHWGEDIISVEPFGEADEINSFLMAMDQVKNNIESVAEGLKNLELTDPSIAYCYIVNLKHVAEALSGDRDVNNVESIYMLDRNLHAQDLVYTSINQPVNSPKKASKK